MLQGELSLQKNLDDKRTTLTVKYFKYTDSGYVEDHELNYTISTSSDVFTYNILRFPLLEDVNTQFEFSKSILQRISESENGTLIESHNYKIENENIDEIQIQWSEDENQTDSNYELRLYYDHVPYLNMEVGIANNDDKTSLLFKFHQVDLSEDLKTKTKFAYFYRKDDTNNKTNLNFDSLHQIEGDSYYNYVYALDLKEKIIGGKYAIHIYIPGYAYHFQELNFNPKYTLNYELYDYESGEYVEKDIYNYQYSAGQELSIKKEYISTISGDSYDITRVLVNDEEIDKTIIIGEDGEYERFDFNMPEENTTVKLYGTLKLKNLNLNSYCDYLNLNGVPVKTITVFGDMDLSKKFYLDGSVTFIDRNDYSEKSFKLSEYTSS